MCAVVLPITARCKPLAGRNRRRVSDRCDEIAMPARLHAQYAEAILFIMIGDPFDEARQNFEVVLNRHIRLRPGVAFIQRSGYRLCPPLEIIIIGLKLPFPGFVCGCRVTTIGREVSPFMPPLFEGPTNPRSAAEASFSFLQRRTGRDRLAAAAILLSTHRDGQIGW